MAAPASQGAARALSDAAMALHMIKLVVGAATIEDLLDWRRRNAVAGQPWVLRTRMTPKRAAEMVDGGSVYRVFKGVILCRQRILGIATVGEGVTARCEVTLDETVVRTAPQPRRAFQGWRYLDPKDAPPDLDERAFGDIPEDLARRLREVGAW
jgi:hypothetical protein